MEYDERQPREKAKPGQAAQTSELAAWARAGSAGRVAQTVSNRGLAQRVGVEAPVLGRRSPVPITASDSEVLQLKGWRDAKGVGYSQDEFAQCKKKFGLGAGAMWDLHCSAREAGESDAAVKAFLLGYVSSVDRPINTIIRIAGREGLPLVQVAALPDATFGALRKGFTRAHLSTLEPAELDWQRELRAAGFAAKVLMTHEADIHKLLDPAPDGAGLARGLVLRLLKEQEVSPPSLVSLVVSLPATTRLSWLQPPDGVWVDDYWKTLKARATGELSCVFTDLAPAKAHELSGLGYAMTTISKALVVATEANKARLMECLNPPQASPNAYGAWLATNLHALWAGKFTVAQIQKMGLYRFSPDLIAEVKLFQRAKPSVGKDVVYPSHNWTSAVRIGHFVRRHTYKHFDFDDIKSENSMWPADLVNSEHEMISAFDRLYDEKKSRFDSTREVKGVAVYMLEAPWSGKTAVTQFYPTGDGAVTYKRAQMERFDEVLKLG